MACLNLELEPKTKGEGQEGGDKASRLNPFMTKSFRHFLFNNVDYKSHSGVHTGNRQCLNIYL